MKTNENYDLIKERVSAALKKQDYCLKSDEEIDAENGSRFALYTTDSKAVALVWNAESKQYVLQLGTVENGEVQESWRSLALWLFDPATQDEADAKSIANDFEDTINSLSPKNAPVTRSAVASTTKKKEKRTPDAFIKKFVSMYPQYQERYDAHLQHYGQLLPDTFVDDVMAEYMVSMLSERKNAFLKKLFEYLDVGYVQGDDEVKSLIMVTLFGHLLADEKIESTANNYMSDALKRAWISMRRLLVKKGATLGR